MEEEDDEEENDTPGQPPAIPQIPGQFLNGGK
jgi:hypothetical protein